MGRRLADPFKSLLIIIAKTARIRPDPTASSPGAYQVGEWLVDIKIRYKLKFRYKDCSRVFQVDLGLALVVFCIAVRNKKTHVELFTITFIAHNRKRLYVLNGPRIYGIIFSLTTILLNWKNKAAFP